MYKAIILGANEITGENLIKELVKAKNWKQIHCIQEKRNMKGKKKQWSPKTTSDKLSFQLVDSLSNFIESSKEIFGKLSSLFCCVGPKNFYEQQEFQKAAESFMYNSLQVAKKLEIPHFSVASCLTEDTGFEHYLNFRQLDYTKIKEENPGAITIFKPGYLICNKDDEYIQEFFREYGFNHVLPEIRLWQFCKGIRIDAEQVHQQEKYENFYKEYESDEIVQLADLEKSPDDPKIPESVTSKMLKIIKRRKMTQKQLKLKKMSEEERFQQLYK